MGTVVWNGDAPAVAQVSTHTVVDTWATNDTATLLCGGYSVTFTVAGTETVAAVVAGLVAAWNLSTDPTLAEITASDTNPSVTLTGTAGVPFITTSSEATAGDGVVGDQVDTTVSSGPNDWSTAANWDTSAVPVDADDVAIENSAISILYGLAQSAVELTSLRVESTMTGAIGLPRTNSGGYVEYRDTALKTSATTATIDGSGSSRINIEWDTDVKTACTVNGTGTAAETNVPPMILSGGHATNTLNVNKGTVGVAYYAGDTASIATADIGYITNKSSDANVSFGSGTTLATLATRGGATVAECAISTALTHSGGTVEVAAAATVATLNNRGGTVYYTSTGTCTTLNASGGSVTDFRRNSSGRTFTNANTFSGAAIYDPAASVTWTNGIDLEQCGLLDVTLDLGDHLTWTPTAID